MNTRFHRSLWTPLLIGLALLALGFAGPAAWPRPDQPLFQTVPTPTPTGGPRPTRGHEAAPPTPTPPPPPPGQTPTPAPDVQITMEASPQAVWSGRDVVFTVRLANVGAGPAADVVLSDLLPTTLVPVEARTDRGDISWQGNLLTVTLGDLAAGETVVLRIVARAATGVSAGEVIENVAEVDYHGGYRAASAWVALPPAVLPAVGGHPFSGPS